MVGIASYAKLFLQFSNNNIAWRILYKKATANMWKNQSVMIAGNASHFVFIYEAVVTMGKLAQFVLMISMI